MMFKKKVEVVEWKDFFDPKESLTKLAPKAALLGTTAAALWSIAQPASASGFIEDKIIKAFDPIIQLLQGAAYPITFLMVTGGFILIIMGKKSKGLEMIKWAAVGYIGLQFAPAVMHILVQVGKAMMSGN